MTFSNVRLAIGSASATTYSYSEIPEYAVSGTTVSSPQNAGGVVGYMSSMSKVEKITVNDVNVQGEHDVGGIAGYCNSSVGTYSSVDAAIKLKGNQYSIGWCDVYGSRITATGYADMYSRTTTDASGAMFPLPISAFNDSALFLIASSLSPDKNLTAS